MSKTIVTLTQVLALCSMGLFLSACNQGSENWASVKNKKAVGKRVVSATEKCNYYANRARASRLLDAGGAYRERKAQKLMSKTGRCMRRYGGL